MTPSIGRKANSKIALVESREGRAMMEAHFARNDQEPCAGKHDINGNAASGFGREQLRLRRPSRVGYFASSEDPSESSRRLIAQRAMGAIAEGHSLCMFTGAPGDSFGLFDLDFFRFQAGASVRAIAKRLAF